MQFIFHQRGQPVVTLAERAIVAPLVQAQWRAIGLVATMIRTRFDGKITSLPATPQQVPQSEQAVSTHPSAR